MDRAEHTGYFVEQNSLHAISTRYFYFSSIVLFWVDLAAQSSGKGEVVSSNHTSSSTLIAEK